MDADRSPDRQPWFIQHRAGNHRAAWRRAVASPADYLEVDVWLQGDRIASHHDPLMHDRLPFLTRRHQLPRLRLPGRARWLEQARAPGRIFLDIKDTRAAAIPAILAALAASGSRPGATASTPIWSQLDALADRAPDIGRFYTLRPQRDADPGGTDGAWTAYLRRADAGQGGAGVSLHRRLATPERLRTLRDRGLRAICYTVNDFDAGLRLLDLGAGGLTSDRADLIPRWQDRWGPPG